MAFLDFWFLGVGVGGEIAEMLKFKVDGVNGLLVLVVQVEPFLHRDRRFVIVNVVARDFLR